MYKYLQADTHLNHIYFKLVGNSLKRKKENSVKIVF